MTISSIEQSIHILPSGTTLNIKNSKSLDSRKFSFRKSKGKGFLGYHILNLNSKISSLHITYFISSIQKLAFFQFLTCFTLFPAGNNLWHSVSLNYDDSVKMSNLLVAINPGLSIIFDGLKLSQISISPGIIIIHSRCQRVRVYHLTCCQNRACRAQFFHCRCSLNDKINDFRVWRSRSWLDRSQTRIPPKPNVSYSAGILTM